MKRINIILLLLFLFTFFGCSSFSQAPGVSAPDKDGYFYTIINKQTYLFYYQISSRNVVVKCSHKTEVCETLNFWNNDGYRIW